jgi:hypothetical protein
MATQSATGPVTCLNVGDDYAFTSIRDQTSGQIGVYILWYYPGDIPVVDRMRLSMWLAMVRDAMSRCIDVSVVHDENDAYVISVQLGD